MSINVNKASINEIIINIHNKKKKAEIFQNTILFTIINLLLASALAFSQDYYISSDLGSDSNAGTYSSPFKTIDKGISMVNPGGTVYVMDGLYQNNNYG